MPIYEYACGACDEKFELLVPMSQAMTLPPCPACKSGETRKLLSLFASHCAGGSSPAGPAGGTPPTGGGHSHGGCGCGH